MLLLRKPSVERLRDFLAAQSKLDLTFPAVGATAAVPPPASERSQLPIYCGVLSPE
jgi:hypothetical protein